MWPTTGQCACWPSVLCTFFIIPILRSHGGISPPQECKQTDTISPYSGCTHKVTLTGGIAINISSPNYPCPLPETVNCIWELDAKRGRLVELHFFTFHLPKHDRSGGCLQAFVEYGHYNALGRRVVVGERICGDLGPFTVTSTSSSYWLSLERFFSSNSSAYNGILVQVKQTFKHGGDSDGDATVVAICAFLVPLFCAFPVYHCFKRMSEVNKRKRLISKMARLREKDRESREQAAIPRDQDKSMKTPVTGGSSEVFKTGEEVVAEFNLVQYLDIRGRNCINDLYNGSNNNIHKPRLKSVTI